MREADYGLVSAKANLLGELSHAVIWRHGGPKPKPPVVRFWIITMMLVLVGLSTLKLR